MSLVIDRQGFSRFAADAEFAVKHSWDAATDLTTDRAAVRDA
ncbi:Uncharacterised protein [Mycobacteroides abscessus subsp. abscessus]|nr:Uncharacterised protein [Mycobacteroides abscessus subsp. abscessus]